MTASEPESIEAYPKVNFKLKGLKTVSIQHKKITQSITLLKP